MACSLLLSIPPTCPPLCAHAGGAGGQGGCVQGGGSHARGEGAWNEGWCNPHGTRDGATHTITAVPSRARKGHVSEAGHNPGRGAMRERKGGCTKAGVQKDDGVPPRACKGEGV